MHPGQNQKPLKKCCYTRITRDGLAAETEEELLQEHTLDIYINDILSMRVVCLKNDLTELVLGRLLSEGLIAGAEDVKALDFSSDDAQVHVQLQIPTRGDDPCFVETTDTCAAGHVFHDRFPQRPLRPVAPVMWKQEWIFQIADHFANGSPLHEKTWAAHSCILARQDEILYACEDLGRHNALDKAFGYALRMGIPLGACTAYSSGRIPTDMAAKAIRAGLPVLVSKASPTAQAVILAKNYQLTLICSARPDRMKVFNSPG